MMDVNAAAWLTVFLLAFVTSDAQNENLCEGKSSCGECISTGPNCAWCKQVDFGAGNYSRCNIKANLSDHGCESANIFYPTHNETLIKAQEPQDSEDGVDTIQLSPQEIYVELRPKLPYGRWVTFRLANNYPVDLYCLMDLSASMKSSKNKLADLGITLAEEMRKITKNFMLGFGSYVDKPTAPYISIIPERLVSPCAETCEATYSFRNEIPLTMNASDFSRKVSEAKISGNLDLAEGTLDGIMQAVSCKEAIGWRNVSRKILLVSTDNVYHVAGDGKLGGIMRPNDGNCHLVNNEYSMSLLQDYPSLGHVAKRIADENINVIFGIVSKAAGVRAAYLPLVDTVSDDPRASSKNRSGIIRGSVLVIMANDSSNVVEVIKQNYEKISSRVELRHDAPAGIDISIIAYCKNDVQSNMPHCDGLKFGDRVKFLLTVTANECPPDPAARHVNVTVFASGLSDKLLLRIHIKCSCDCEQADYVEPPEENSTRCNSLGAFQCGACACYPGIRGSQCDCDERNPSLCQMTPSSAMCSGQGQCQCGNCVCDQLSVSDPSKRYSGRYCECNDYSCDNFAGRLCGGPARGTCKCGECICKPGYTGSDCACSTSVDSCISKNNKVCNGHGQCVCGECRCEPGYQGDYCELCPTCPGQCELNKACVQCVAFQTGPYSANQCQANCSHIHIVEHISQDGTDDDLVCKFRDPADECDFYFLYSHSSNQVRVQEKKECPTSVSNVGTIIGVVGAVIGVGVVLLSIWKCVITIYDRKEYAKFVNERNAAKWQVDDNPIYKPSTSTFTNPTFRNQK